MDMAPGNESLFVTDTHSLNFYQRMRITYGCGLHTDADYIRMRITYGCGLHTDADYIRMRITITIHKT
jgi:hypothetical protein